MSSGFCIISLLVTLLCGAQAAWADDTDVSADHFDGSEYNAASFRDSQFDKQTYADVLRTRPVLKTDNRLLRPASLFKRNEAVGVGTVESREAAVKDVSEKLGERPGPVHDLPGDWVPDKISLTSNGGFSDSPPNAAVVPYRLNGHVDIQRGRPGDLNE